MDVTPAAITAIRRSFNRLFQSAATMKAPKSRWMQVATRAPSGTAANLYAWLSRAPHMRRWDAGVRVRRNMRALAYTLTNDKFEDTVEVSITDIEDDNIGVYRPRVMALGMEAHHYHIDRNVFAALKDGFTGLCYDAKPFFATDHPVYANVDGTGDTTATSNIIEPTTTDGPGWYLLDTMSPLLPLIYQTRVEPQFQTLDDAGVNQVVFDEDLVLYGVRARRAFGYGMWRSAVGCRDTLNAANFDAAMELIGQVKEDGGDPAGCMGTLLVAPYSLRAEALEVIKNERLANGATNKNYMAADLLITPWLS